MKVVFEHHGDGNVMFRVCEAVGSDLVFEFSTGADAMGVRRWEKCAYLPIGAIRELVRLACGTDIEMKRKYAEDILHSAHEVLAQATKRSEEIVDRARETLLREQAEAADALLDKVNRKEKTLDKEAEKGLKEMKKRIDKSMEELRKKFEKKADE